MRITLLDNFDSFTYNLVEQFCLLGAEVRVMRNDTPLPTIQAALLADGCELLVLSPGPGRPEDAGCMLELLAWARGRLPVLGVCLGHQALALAAGGAVGEARKPLHGKSTSLRFDQRHRCSTASLTCASRATTRWWSVACRKVSTAWPMPMARSWRWPIRAIDSWACSSIPSRFSPPTASVCWRTLYSGAARWRYASAFGPERRCAVSTMLGCQAGASSKRWRPSSRRRWRALSRKRRKLRSDSSAVL